MKQAVIDIGSNSIRLSLYSVESDSDFKILFKEKIMAGLAGYVEDGALSAEGVARACSALLEFKNTLELLNIKRASVFATASLRNVSNTQEALTKIEAATGFVIELLSGEEEAQLGYAGAMQELHISGGVFVDIGGASTELVTFEGGDVKTFMSFSVGSLSLYRSCVKNILPNTASLKRIEDTLRTEIDEKSLLPIEKRTPLVCVGGTSRAVLKLAKRQFDLSETCRCVTAQQFKRLCSVLRRGDKEAADLILKTDADRIHTLVPGIMILRHIRSHFAANKLIVGNYGIREGYLCQRILKNNTYTHKTGS